MDTPAPEEMSGPLHQKHVVQLGDRVHLNGSLFTVSSNQYEWHMICPDGTEGQMMNATMVSPSFLADQLGVYAVTLPTDDGLAEILVEVQE